MTNIQTNQTENKSEDKSELTPCEELGYRVGDMFEVTDIGNSFYCKGMIVKLDEDDGSYAPFFTYVRGPFADETHEVAKIVISLNFVRKFSQKAELAKPAELIQVAEVIQDNLLYSTEDIDAAFEYLEWLDVSKSTLMDALKVVTDSEYKEYLRLKDKYEVS